MSGFHPPMSFSSTIFPTSGTTLHQGQHPSFPFITPPLLFLSLLFFLPQELLSFPLLYSSLSSSYFPCFFFFSVLLFPFTAHALELNSISLLSSLYGTPNSSSLLYLLFILTHNLCAEISSGFIFSKWSLHCDLSPSSSVLK